MLTLNENRCKVRSVFVNNIYEAENQFLPLLRRFNPAEPVVGKSVIL